MSARNHHYLSQFYLRGFTRNGSKNSKLLVIDLEGKKHFETVTRNVGGVRDFNRIDVSGIDPNEVEKRLSEFEGEVASAFGRIEKNLDFSGKTKNLILNYIAFLFVHTPDMRENRRRFIARVSEGVLGLALSSKELWDSQMEQARKNGMVTHENIDYEEHKKFYQNKKYTIQVPNEHHLKTELSLAKSILPSLHRRKWRLIKSSDISGIFVTTDNPVSLTWKNPEDIPQKFRNSPGHELRDTELYFPLSRNLALLGDFDGPEGVFEGGRKAVADLNSNILMFAHKQIYAPKMVFYFFGRNAQILEGMQILNHIKQHK